MYVFYFRNKINATHKRKYYLIDLLSEENDPENIYLLDSDDNEYFPEDQCSVSDTEETTDHIIYDFFFFFIITHLIIFTIILFK